MWSVVDSYPLCLSPRIKDWKKRTGLIGKTMRLNIIIKAVFFPNPVLEKQWGWFHVLGVLTACEAGWWVGGKKEQTHFETTAVTCRWTQTRQKKNAIIGETAKMQWFCSISFFWIFQKMFGKFGSSEFECTTNFLCCTTTATRQMNGWVWGPLLGELKSYQLNYNFWQHLPLNHHFCGVNHFEPDFRGIEPKFQISSFMSLPIPWSYSVWSAIQSPF